MNEVVKYLQECGTFYLATVEGDQPHVRPFGAVCEFEGKLYIVTNNKKAVYNQMKANKSALQSMYTVDDNLMTVFAFESGSATIYSFTEEPKAINL